MKLNCDLYIFDQNLWGHLAGEIWQIAVNTAVCLYFYNP